LWSPFGLLGLKGPTEAVPSEEGEGERIYCLNIIRGMGSRQSVLFFRGIPRMDKGMLLHYL